MTGNQLVPFEPRLPSVLKKESKEASFAVVKYEPIDSQHYSFSYRLADDVEMRMDESARTTEYTDFVEAEFVEAVPESDKTYYAIAAASGILTGALSMLHLKEEQLQAIEDFKDKEWKPLIVSLANFVGYKKSDYKGASKYLVTRAVRTVEKNEKTKECLTVLAEHPSLAGLVFSVLQQFCGKAISVSDNGTISKHKLPDYYVVGDTNAEKIVYAVFYWLFALAADEAISKRHVLDEMGISKELLAKIKEFANIPFIKDIPSNYEESERKFSEWLKNTIAGAELYSEDDDDNKKVNPLFALLGFALNFAEDAFPVLVNECIVRSLYMLVRICGEVKNRHVTSFDELMMIPAKDILPVDDHVLSRMSLIASASFVGANIAGATLKAVKDKKQNGKKFSDTFLAEINIAGIGRFLFACASDSKYWGEDIKIMLQRAKRAQDVHVEGEPSLDEEEAFEPLLLDAIQARVLYCLESALVQYDISKTSKPDVAAKKRLWLDTWKGIITNGLDLAPELAAQYFIDDEDYLYNGIFQLARDKSNWRWFYLLTQELALFEPYTALGSDSDKEFRKLKVDTDYVTDQFVRRQTIVTQSEVDAITKAYSKYKGYVSGSTQNKIIGTAAAAVVAVATGGVALTFAPGIAAAIAGEAVVGLHGAALTSASLAFVGGGSLAAGGLGMAGGTAIITGGGALLGLVGSGTVSAATILLQTPGEYWVRQSAKLLTYSSCILHDNLRDKAAVLGMLCQVEKVIRTTETELEALNAAKNDLDKEMIKKTEEYLKYLKKCKAELQKLSK